MQHDLVGWVEEMFGLNQGIRMHHGLYTWYNCTDYTGCTALDGRLVIFYSVMASSS
jgi:hypothetical protein